MAENYNIAFKIRKKFPLFSIVYLYFLSRLKWFRCLAVMFVRLWQIASFLLMIITNNQAKWSVRSSVQSAPNIHWASLREETRASGLPRDVLKSCREKGGVVVEETLPGIYFYLAVGTAWHHLSHHDKFGRKIGYLIVSNTAYVSKLFLSCGTIDFSLSCCQCQHYVLVYHSLLAIECPHTR